MTVTDKQVKLYMSKRTTEPQEIAALKAGLSERTGQRIERGKHAPHQGKLRHYSTRKDPFAAVWEGEIVPLLQKNPKLMAITIMGDLQKRYPGRYDNRHLRTLQRRIKRWRALSGPECEVMFSQLHEPGQMGLSDFTLLKNCTITIQGEPLNHRLYHFRLAYSRWSSVQVVLGGESFPALAGGLRRALEQLGGVPREHRSDSLSAAYKNLSAEAQKDFSTRYHAFCDHYGMMPSRNNRGESHENGSVESAHGHLKARIEQQLMLRGSSDFVSHDAYQQWLDRLVEDMNAGHAIRVSEERSHLRPLPNHPGIDYNEWLVRVSVQSSISVDKVVYSVPSRLIGSYLKVHLYDDHLVAWLGCDEVFRSPRHRSKPGSRKHARCIDYRHWIASLKKKPGAFYHSVFRNEILPNETYRAIWSHLDTTRSSRDASKLMVGILAYAAEYHCEEELGHYLMNQIASNTTIEIKTLQERFGRLVTPIAEPSVNQHPLQSYDQLLPSRREVPHVYP